MHSKYSVLAATSAAILLGACAESTSSPDPLAPPSSVDATRSQEFNSRHIFHTKDFYSRSNALRPNGSGIYYHGGPLIVNPVATNVVAVYWGVGAMYDNGPASGIGDGSQDASLIGTFLRNLGGSAYFGINTTYYNGSNLHVLNTVNYTGFWVTGSTPGATG